MLLLVIPVILMSSIGSYKFLSYLSIPSVMIAITGMLCIFYYLFSQINKDRASNLEELKIFDFWKMMGRIGLAMYLFDGTAIVINVQSEAGELRNKYPKILMKAVLFDLILFLCFATICYSVYGETGIKPIFTMSLVPIDSMVIFIFICVCINALTSYPI